MSDYTARFSACAADDLVHRGSARLVDKNGALWRPMHKWQFLRTTEPIAPTWNHNPATCPSFDPHDTMTPIYESVWSWLCGLPPPARPTLAAWNTAHVDCIHADRHPGDEPERLAAAHLLGQAAYHGDSEALDALTRGLTDPREAVRRSCVHGLAAAGDAATPAALAALRSLEPPTIGLGADVLGECALRPTTEAVAAVSAALTQLAVVIATAGIQLPNGAQDTKRSGKGPISPEWLAVQACVQCLGVLAQRCEPKTGGETFSEIVSTLIPHLRSESDAVRRKAAEAAMPLCNSSMYEITAGCGEATLHALVDGLRHCLLDSNRYVIASGAEGLVPTTPVIQSLCSCKSFCSHLTDQQPSSPEDSGHSVSLFLPLVRQSFDTNVFSPEQVRLAGQDKSQSAKQAVLTQLVDKRWCPITNPASQF